MKIKFDGKELDVKPMDINQLIEVEDKFGSLAKLQDTKEIPLRLVRYVAFVCLKPHLPGVTEEQIGEKLDFETISEVMKLMNPTANVGADRPLAQP